MSITGVRYAGSATGKCMRGADMGMCTFVFWTCCMMGIGGFGLIVQSFSCSLDGFAWEFPALLVMGISLLVCSLIMGICADIAYYESGALSYWIGWESYIRILFIPLVAGLIFYTIRTIRQLFSKGVINAYN